MVTARETHADKREGFLAGTDDYMVKPFDTNELVARVRTILRRAKKNGEEQDKKDDSLNKALYKYVHFHKVFLFYLISEVDSLYISHFDNYLLYSSYFYIDFDYYNHYFGLFQYYN